MKTFLVATGLLAVSGLIGAAALADNTNRNDQVTVAVFGDWPYSQLLLDNAGLLLNSINGDPDVSTVIHVGDIHSGSMPCTSAGILPPIPKSNPGWNQGIYYVFQQFTSPLVYTPGDNEWTDCHKAKQFVSGAPLKELASVRQLFFARAGHSLGAEDKQLLSQAVYFDPANPADAQFVENVMWEDAKVMFVTVNLPGGSNNDDPTAAPWTSPFTDPAAQATEQSQRTAADIRWLQAAFTQAAASNDKAVVVVTQADMWDTEALPTPGLDKYTPFVKALADATRAFGGQVLLLNGDSHLFKVDHPLAAGSPVASIHNITPAVPNLTRIVVQGSTNAPAEWLRLTIDGRKPYPFSFRNVPYCKDPLTAC
jgi:hypothetical protein